MVANCGSGVPAVNAAVGLPCGGGLGRLSWTCKAAGSPDSVAVAPNARGDTLLRIGGISIQCSPLSAPVAQLDRVLGYEPRGRGFESCRAHQ